MTLLEIIQIGLEEQLRQHNCIKRVGRSVNGHSIIWGTNGYFSGSVTMCPDKVYLSFPSFNNPTAGFATCTTNHCYVYLADPDFFEKVVKEFDAFIQSDKRPPALSVIGSTPSTKVGSEGSNPSGGVTLASVKII